MPAKKTKKTKKPKRTVARTQVNYPSKSSSKDSSNPFTNHSLPPIESSENYGPDKIQNVLKSHYKNNLSIRRLFYPDFPIPIENNYIALSILPGEAYQEQLNESANAREEITEDSYEFSTRLYGHGEGIIALEDIIPRYDAKVSKRQLLVLGAAGIGKSTLSDRLCHIWSLENDSDLSQRYDWVFKIPLRNLTVERYSSGKVQVIDIIEKECLTTIFEQEDKFLSESDRNTLETRLNQATEVNKVLFIIDGFDEINENDDFIIQPLKTLLSFQQVILTSRPYNLAGLRQTYNFKEQQSYEITGFTPVNIKQYVNDFFENLPVSKLDAAKDFCFFLEQNPNLSGVCRIPINVELLCSAWDKQPLVLGNYSVTKIYNEVTRSLCHRYLEKKEQDIRDVDRIKILNMCEEQLMFLEHLGYQSAYSGQLFIEGGNTSEYMRSLPEVKDRSSFLTSQKAFGFIRPNNSKGDYDGVSPYYFSHLTFRDYFAARFLAQCLQKHLNKKSLFKHQWPNPSDTSLVSYLEEHRFNQRYEFIWWFMIGLLKEEDKLPALKCLLSILIADFDKSGSSRLLLLIRCLDESYDEHRRILPPALWTYVSEWLSLAFKPFFKLLILSQDSPLIERLKISPTIIYNSEIQDFFCDAIAQSKNTELHKIIDFLSRTETKLPQRISKAIAGKIFKIKSKSLGSVEDYLLLKDIIFQVGNLVYKKYIAASLFTEMFEGKKSNIPVFIVRCVLLRADELVKGVNLFSSKNMYEHLVRESSSPVNRLVSAMSLHPNICEIGLFLILEQINSSGTNNNLANVFVWNETLKTVNLARNFRDFLNPKHQNDFYFIKLLKNINIYLCEPIYFENLLNSLSQSSSIKEQLTFFSCWVLSLTNSTKTHEINDLNQVMQLFVAFLKNKELEQEKNLFIELLLQLVLFNQSQNPIQFIEIRGTIIKEIIENFDCIKAESIKKYVALFITCYTEGLPTKN